MKLYSAYEAAMDSSSLSNTLKNIESWSHNWQLLINPEKSLLLQFGSSKHDRPLYFICDKLIAPSDLVRDLGITYDSNLCFPDYINEIVGIAYQRVNLLFRSFVSQKRHAIHVAMQFMAPFNSWQSKRIQTGVEELPP